MNDIQNVQHLQKFGRAPALIAPQFAHELSVLSSAPERGSAGTERAVSQCAALYGMQAQKGKPFLFAGGIAVIPVYGALLHRDPWCDSYATGYDYISACLSAAMGDDEVKGVLWDINSYGGHVAGNFELCEDIYNARSKKPMMAVVDSRALSGGYSIASAVGRIIATQSASIGSVGVVMMHMAYEEMLKTYGIDVTFIFAGDHKVDGNPYERLPKEVKAAFQRSIDKSYGQFVELVSRNRTLDADVVRSTEARVYDADEAKSIGLIDDVLPPRAAYALFLSELSGSTQTPKEKKMSNETPQQQAQGGEGGAAPAAAAPTVDTNALAADARAQERARVAGITGCDEAKNKQALANHLAMNTDMSVEDAKKVLGAAADEKKAEASAPAGPSALAAAMTTTGGGPDIGADAAGGEEPKEMSRGERLAAAHAKATGRKYEPAKK